MASSRDCIPNFLPVCNTVGIWKVLPSRRGCDGWRGNKNFQSRTAASRITAFEERLRHHRLQGVRQRGADLLLLIMREDVDNAVHGLRGTLGVQCAKHQVPR